MSFINAKTGRDFGGTIPEQCQNPFCHKPIIDEFWDEPIGGPWGYICPQCHDPKMDNIAFHFIRKEN